MLSTENRSLVQVLGGSVILCSLAAILGHTFHLPWLYHYLGGVGMAFNTAVCLLFLGIALVTLSRGK